MSDSQVPGVNAASSLGEAEVVSPDVLPEAAGGCVGADVSEPVLPQAVSSIVREIAREAAPAKYLFFIINRRSFPFVSWVPSACGGLVRILFPVRDVIRSFAGIFAAPMMSCYTIGRVSCQQDFIIVHEIERICSYKIRYQYQISITAALSKTKVGIAVR